MSHGALADAGRFASTYARELADGLDEAMRDHELVARCWEFEDALALLGRLLGNVVFFGAKALAARGEASPPGVTAIERQFAGDLRGLADQCAEVDRRIAWYEARGMAVEGADGFRRKRAAIGSLCRAVGVPDGARPVGVDEGGRLVEATGERIDIPGLGPESILAGLADRAAGRFSRLSDIQAEPGR